MDISLAKARRRDAVGFSLRTVKALAQFSRAKPLGAIGGIIMVLALGAAVFASWLAPYDPLALDTTRILIPPGNQGFILGTDFLGRDVLSRIIFGAQISLYVAVASVVIGIATGALFGGVAAYFGGKLDLIIQRIMDAVMAFPTLILGLAIMAALRQDINNVVLAIAIVFMPRTARMLRSAVLSIKENQYIDAARAIGCSDVRIMLQHIAPNAAAVAIVIASVNLGLAMLIEGSLSFLGIGVPPPAPSWGNMVAGSAIEYAQQAPFLPLFPGIALTLTVFGFNVLGDALRDVLDPRLRAR